MTATWTVVALEIVHESIELPEPMTLVGERLQEVLLADRETTPANPFTALMIMVEMPGLAALTVTVEGLEAIVKSRTTNVALAEWDRLLLVPVIIRV